MTKQERINEIAATLALYREELVTERSVPMTNAYGDAVGCYYTKEVDTDKIGQLLVEAGFGDLRSYRAKIIELYLKGNTVELVKFIMEEV
jgi:hypothetical protein